MRLRDAYNLAEMCETIIFGKTICLPYYFGINYKQIVSREADYCTFFVF